MRILITGGAGFLGAALANRLVGPGGGHTVLVLDDLSTGDPRRLDPRVLFTRGEVKDVPKLWTMLQGVDCVYHLAARVRVPESIYYPGDYNDCNVGGTVALMEAVRDTGVKRVVLTSSAALYGEQTEQPISESQPPNPNSPYGVSKLAAEYYVSTLGQLNGIETVSLRVFNAYGPGQDLPPSYPPVIPHLLKQALTGGSLVIFGDGTQTRDFVYVDDVVDALVTAVTASEVNRAVINIGSGQETSIQDLAGRIVRATGRKANVLYNRAQGRGVTRLVADVTLAQRLLGWSPSTSLDVGLRLTLERDARFGGAPQTGFSR
ncbi:MAG TPA: NAD-dependent epimerase/dehydratase family protein [Anaerolineae bacterium]|nr:NAD-dependent epimerase/dehydratase family protein [Anaerolineae bacterium]